MRKASLGIISSSMFVLALAFSSCNTESAPPKDDTSESRVAPVISAPAPLANDTLDVLFMTSDLFVAAFDTTKKKKLTFRFYVTNPDSLTMHGWINTKDTIGFPGATPNIKLWNGVKTKFTISAGTYLGNSVLYHEGIKAIFRDIKTSGKPFVAFIPQDPASNGGQIIYDVMPVINNPHSLTFPDIDKLVLTVIANTNPSPPRPAN